MPGAWWLVFCALSGFPGAQSQMQLVESGGAVRNEGESTRLSCKGSGFTFSSSDMFWYRQSPGTGPEFVSSIYDDGSSPYYAAWVQGRFTISRDNAKSELYLAMSRLRRGDTARYHCAAREAPVFTTVKLTFGNGTKLTVQPDQTTSEPSVSIMKSENESIAACLAKDFYPKELKILMNSDSEIIFEATDPILTSSGKYSAVKVVKLSSNELVSCSVQHNSKLIKKTQTAEKPPEVGPIEDITSPTLSL
uniref:Ig-like domain-containing protein n=1 Tax=Chrysemys picta bellii TaxID=8478 RepID=A0A8C3IDI7_CHRPI